MTNFSDQFQHFLPPGDDVIADGFTKGMLVFDSNVLLGIYRFAPRSRNELLDTLALLRDRLWIPHQVGLEFHKNRLTVIAEHDAAYRSALESYEARRQEMEVDTEKKIRELSNRVALPDGDRDRLLNMLRTSGQPLRIEIDKLRAGHGVGGPMARDVILERINEIFAERVGLPFSPEEVGAEMNEAESRVALQRPPGYKDASKSEPHGDYFVWSQTLKEAGARKAEILIFVTGDVKEDWYLKVKGQTVMARPELAQECKERTGARLAVLPTRSFLSYARRFLSIEVSDETIQQAERASHLAERSNLLKHVDRRIREARILSEKMENVVLEARDEKAFLRGELESASEQEHEIRVRLSKLYALVEGGGSKQHAEELQIAQADLNDLLARQAHLDSSLRRVDSRINDAQEALDNQRRKTEKALAEIAMLVDKSTG